MSSSPDFDRDRRNFLGLMGLAPFAVKEAIDRMFTEPNLVEIPSVQVHLLDPALMEIEDAGSRLVRLEAMQFQDAIYTAAQAVGVVPEVIGMSDPIGPFRGTGFSKVQILGGVPVDTLPGSPLAPAIVDAIIDRKSKAATLVMSGLNANLYPVNKVRFEIDNGIPKVAFTGGTDTVVEAEVREVVKDGVTKQMFSRIAVEGYLVDDNQLLEASKLLGITAIAPRSPMAEAFKKWILSPWMSLWTPDPQLEAQLEKPLAGKIFSVGSIRNQLNDGTADSITIPLAVKDGKRTISLNSDNDVEITDALAVVEQKLKAQTGLSGVGLVLYQAGDLSTGSTQPNIVSVDSANVMPREETQPTSVLVDLSPTVDEKTNDVVWYDKDGKPMFVTLYKKPGVLYRVVGFKTDQQVNKVTDMKPVAGIDTVPTVSLVPSEAAIKNFAPKTFAEAVQGRIPDRLLKISLSDATKNMTLQEALKKLGITSTDQPPQRIWQNTRLSLGAPAFGVIASVFNVLGLGEKIVTLPQELIPSAVTPITAKIVFVSPVNNPDKPFPVLVGYTYSHLKQQVVVGSPEIYQQVGSRLTPDKTHIVGNLRPYELALAVGMDEVTLANGKDVGVVLEGPNKAYFATVGQKLKEYFGMLDFDGAKKIIQPGGPGTPEDKQALLEEAMKRPVKLAWRLTYKV